MSTQEFSNILKKGLRITGVTYPHRDTIKAAGCVWANRDKAWFAPTEEIRGQVQKIVDGTIYNSPPPADLTGNQSPEIAAEKFARKAISGAKTKSFSVYGLSKGDNGDPDGTIHKIKGIRYVQVARTKREYLSADWLEDMDMFNTKPGGSYQWDGVAVEPTPEESTADQINAHNKQCAAAAPKMWEAVVAKIDQKISKCPVWASASTRIAIWHAPVMIHTGAFPEIHISDTEIYYHVPGYFACDWDYGAVHRTARLTPELKTELDAAIAACRAQKLLR